MEFFLGLLTAVVFFICILGAYYVGLRTATHNPKTNTPDDEQTRRMKQIHSDFTKLMNYSEETALQRKQVK